MRFVTTAEQVGIWKGIEQGIEQGLEQGVVKGEMSLLSRQLKRRFGRLSSYHQQRLQQADSETLLSWGERLLDAKSLEEVFQ